MKLSAFVLCILLLSTCGCGSGNGDTGKPTPVTTYPNIAGNWVFDAPAAQIGIFLAQGSGGALSGTGHTDSNCFQQSTDLPFTGTIDTNGDLILNSAAVDTGAGPGNATIQIRGNVQNGTLTTPSVGVSCSGTAGAGILGGNLLPSTTGTWAASLSSSENPALALSMNLTQGTSPDKDGYLSLTGTGTFSGSCLGTQPLTLSATTQTLPSFESPMYNILVGPFVSIGFSNAQNDSITLVGDLSSNGTQLDLIYWSITTPTCRDEGGGSIAKQS